MNESDLFQPIKNYLLENNYTVNSEVLHCDIIAKKNDEVIAIELKKKFNATLLIQAVDRQKFADSVYVAIFKPKNRKKYKNWRGMCQLLKRLEIGLILVSFLKTKAKVEVLIHPSNYVFRKNKKKRKAVLKEINNRSGNYNKGGISRKKIITAYREKAIFIACCLNRFGELSTKKLKKLGTGEKTTTILYKNFYGWFERVDRGVYRLHNNGIEALNKYSVLATIFYKDLNKLNIDEIIDIEFSKYISRNNI